MLQENGFVLKSQKGSHMKFEKDGKVVIVPNHNGKGVEKGTFYTKFQSESFYSDFTYNRILHMSFFFLSPIILIYSK